MAKQEELLEDLIKVHIADLVQWVAIRSTEFTSQLSPYQRAVQELADKYGVPSPFDKDEPVRPAPVPPKEG